MYPTTPPNGNHHTHVHTVPKKRRTGRWIGIGVAVLMLGGCFAAIGESEAPTTSAEEARAEAPVNGAPGDESVSVPEVPLARKHDPEMVYFAVPEVLEPGTYAVTPDPYALVHFWGTCADPWCERAGSTDGLLRDGEPRGEFVITGEDPVIWTRGVELTRIPGSGS